MERLKESETLELKKSTSELKEGVISIASILNKHQKGTLYFGIKNDGTVVGQDISEKGSEKSSEKIIEIIRENKSATAKDISEIIGIGQRAVEKQISQLKKKGILRRVGPDKGGSWEVILLKE